jgi:Tol biopolymer transport system component
LFYQRFSVISPSGSRVAFSTYEDDNRRVVYVAVPGGSAEKMCEACLRATDWSNDEKTLLMFGGNPYQINVLDVASHRQTPLLTHPTYQLLYAHYSPDNHWVSFTVRKSPSRATIMLAPLNGAKLIPEEAWVPVAEVSPEDWANWSPDGKTLYFTSNLDGHFCLWGQRLDSISHRPVGDSFAVLHLHGRAVYAQAGWSASGGRVAMVLVENIGNIWMMSRPGRQ